MSKRCKTEKYLHQYVGVWQKEKNNSNHQNISKDISDKLFVHSSNGLRWLASQKPELHLGLHMDGRVQGAFGDSWFLNQTARTQTRAQLTWYIGTTAGGLIHRATDSPHRYFI